MEKKTLSWWLPLLALGMAVLPPLAASAGGGSEEAAQLMRLLLEERSRIAEGGRAARTFLRSSAQGRELSQALIGKTAEYPSDLLRAASAVPSQPELATAFVEDYRALLDRLRSGERAATGVNRAPRLTSPTESRSGPLEELVQSQLSSDERTLASITRRGQLRIVDIAEGRLVTHASPPGDFVLSPERGLMGVSPDSEKVLTTFIPDKLGIWNARTGEVSQTIDLGLTPRESLMGAGLAANDQAWALVSCSGCPSSIRVYDAASGAWLRTVTLERRLGTMFQGAPSPDGRYLLTGSRMGVFRWKTSDWSRVDRFPLNPGQVAAQVGWVDSDVAFVVVNSRTPGVEPASRFAPVETSQAIFFTPGSSTARQIIDLGRNDVPFREIEIGRAHQGRRHIVGTREDDLTRRIPTPLEVH